MLYSIYEQQRTWAEPLRLMAGLTRDALSPFTAWLGPAGMSHLTAGLDLFSRAAFTHDHPGYRIDRVEIDGQPVRVIEEPAARTAFCTLLRFHKENVEGQPKVLVVAPLSGHFATLLRDTVRKLLVDHDVYLTDWHNARDIPVGHGDFGFDDCVDHIITFLETMGPRAHVIAVCQPCVQVLAAVAIMAEDKNPASPLSMTLMAGPIDTSVRPTKVNDLASSHPLSWFAQNLISEVPAPLKGAGRKVYPGFVQLGAFLSMNGRRHVNAHRDLYQHLATGDAEQAAEIKSFYDEYFAVFDLPARFYLETVERVFQKNLLANGALSYRGRPVHPAAIRKTKLLTVEGEHDDICGVGQTSSAHDLCTGLKASSKRHHLQPGVGHYGVFSGRRWRTQIYPIIRRLIAKTAERR
ncbi:MAG: polyhydroxyalkanoate depolymerase [Rhodospirillaceae bacterium]